MENLRLIRVTWLRGRGRGPDINRDLKVLDSPFIYILKSIFHGVSCLSDRKLLLLLQADCMRMNEDRDINTPTDVHSPCLTPSQTIEM